MERISSSDNITIKMVRHLFSSRKHREREGLFPLEGLNAVNALFDSEQQLLKAELLLVCDSFVASEKGAQISAKAAGLRQVIVADDLLERVQDTRTSQGVVAIARIPRLPRPDPLPAGNYLLADNISDPGNMGTLIRSAVAADFMGLLLGGDCVDIYNPKCVRSTAGTLPFLPAWKVGYAEIGDFRTQGFDIIAAQMGTGDSVYEMQLGPRNILAVGNEAHGLSRYLQDNATRALHIPINARCESLNASVAGSLIMLAMRNFSQHSHPESRY